MGEVSTLGWQVVGQSVLGASHLRSALPNQDAIGWFPEGDKGDSGLAPAVPAIILAVADGHGSPRSFRSDRGARLAVAAALAELGELFLAAPRGLSAIKRLAEDQLPQSLLRRWRSDVLADLRVQPITADELDKFEKRLGLAARERLMERLRQLAPQPIAPQGGQAGERATAAEDAGTLEGGSEPLAVYGATLLCVVATDSYVIYAQLGDGDILTVDEQGQVLRPIAHDARLMGNETTSLCSPAAEREVRVAFHALNGPAPALILLSTDGYANSFRDEASFAMVGADVFEMVRRDGFAAVGSEVAGWLDEATKVGSGDDITLGIICRAAFAAGGSPLPVKARDE